MYAIQNIKTGEFLCGTNFGYGPDGNTQRTSLDQMLTFDNLRYAKSDYISRRCNQDYRIVRLKTPEVDHVIDFDLPDGYDYYIGEEGGTE